jgi:hypothetical protein
MPNAGGLLDQPATFLEAIRVLESTINEIDQSKK